MSIKDKIAEKGSLPKFDNFEKVQSISLESLEIIDDQPFKEYRGTLMYNQLKESIQKNNITAPLIVREVHTANEIKMVILSGRHRYLVAKDLGFSTVPCIVKKNLTDDQAQLILLDSNLCQREELLPSEKAFSYKQKFEILKRQGSRSDLFDDSNKGVRTSEMLGEELGCSKDEIHRCVKLTQLIKELLDKVDDKSMPFGAGYTLSFISHEVQQFINTIMDENKVSMSLKTATALKKAYESNNDISKEEVEKIMVGSKAIASTKVSFKSFRQDYLSEYFNGDVSNDEVIKTIQEALKLYFFQK